MCIRDRCTCATCTCACMHVLMHMQSIDACVCCAHACAPLIHAPPCTTPPGSTRCRPGCLTRSPARRSGRPCSICARATRSRLRPLSARRARYLLKRSAERQRGAGPRGAARDLPRTLLEYAAFGLGNSHSRMSRRFSPSVCLTM